MSDQKEVIEAEIIDHQKRFDLVDTGDNLPAFTPMTMIERAMATGADVDQLAKFWELQVKYEEREAKKAFLNAMSSFKSECPVIPKNSKGQSGKFAGLCDIAKVADPLLAKNCLSYRWEQAQTEGSKDLTVTCIVTHSDGHSVSSPLTGPLDTSGNKNSIQSIGSSNKYLFRYTLEAALGLASAEMDDDGNGGGPGDVINECQLADLEALAEEVGVKVDKFCTFLKVSSLEFLPVAHYDAAVKSLEKRRAK